MRESKNFRDLTEILNTRASRLKADKQALYEKITEIEKDGRNKKTAPHIRAWFHLVLLPFKLDKTTPAIIRIRPIVLIYVNGSFKKTIPQIYGKTIPPVIKDSVYIDIDPDDFSILNPNML